MAHVSLTSCPQCGQSFYPEDEPGTNNSRPLRSRGEGLVLRVVAFVLIGALLGGSLSLVAGTSWVWLTILGGIIVGLVGIVGFGKH
ncbi:MAG: hypothetical protein Q7U74_04665 [Saprospiraceae bacterium]|nr:hypothetical protein [Saprospiraceae bacterium]